MVSKAWKDLPNDERQSWNDRADRDKERYEVEKTMYSGPWKVLADKKKADKDPDAPKRPMSAFLSFSHTKRSKVRESNPNLTNAETCRILAQLWKDAPDEVKKPHIDQEFKLRQEYKAAIAVWREEAERKKTLERQGREDIALRAVADIKMRKQQATTAAHYGGAQEEHPHYNHHHGESIFTTIDEATTTPFFTRNDHAVMESYPPLHDTTMPPLQYAAPGIQYPCPRHPFPLPPSSRDKYYAYNGVDEVPLQLHSYYSSSYSYPPSRSLRPPPPEYYMMGPPTTSTSSWGYGGMATSTAVDEHSASYQDTSSSAGTPPHLTPHLDNYKEAITKRYRTGGYYCYGADHAD
jgi:HMG (high mobility group) box